MASPAVPVVEMAFGDGYGTAVASMSWTDVSAYVRSVDGLNVNVGRRDERSVADPNTLTLELNNDDGRFTPGNSSGAYYPDVKVGVPVRVRCTYPTEAEGNYVGNSAFEAGTTGWSAGGTVPPTLSQSSTHAHSGTYALRVAWGTGGTFPLAQTTVTGLTIGVVYTASMWVYVPTGDPNVLVAIGGGGGVGVNTGVKDQWVQITKTWTASSTSHAVQIWPNSSPTSGDLVWVDDVQVNQGSTVAAVFTEETPVAYTRFLGFVDDWTTQWPATTDNHSVASVTASSRLSRLGAAATLRSLSQQTILEDSPVLFWPCSEAEGATRAASIGTSSIELRRTTVGGTTPTFGDSHGPPYEDATAVLLKAASNSSTNWAGGRLKPTDELSWASSFTWECLAYVSFDTTAPSATMELIYGEAADGSLIRFYILYNTGGGSHYVLATLSDSGGDNLQATTFGTTGDDAILDGNVHHFALVVDGTDIEVFIDGVSVDTGSNASFGGISDNLPFIGRVTDEAAGRLALSNVAYFDSALSSTRIAAHSDAALTAYLDETPAARLTKYSAFAGVAATETDFEDGQLLNLANIETSDTAAIDLMRIVELTESGVLFDAPDGTLTFHDRAHRYGATATSLPAGAGGIVQGDFAPILDRSTLTNDATATSLDGTATETAFGATSQADYGLASTSAELATSNTNELRAWVDWQIANYAEPANRAPVLTVDLAAATAEERAAILPLTIGSKITATGLPSQAGASSQSFFVEGWSETITPGSHRLTFNVSPSGLWDQVLILDDATYGLPDGNNVLAI